MCQHPIKPESPAVDPVVKRQTFDIGQKRVGEIIANPKLLIIVEIPRCLMSSGSGADTFVTGDCACATPSEIGHNIAKPSGNATKRNLRIPDELSLPVASVTAVRSLLCAVIRMSGQNGRGPVDLFQQHHAHHLMRPGGLAKRNPDFGFAPQFGRKSVSAANKKYRRHRLVTPSSKMTRECGAVDGIAALIKRNDGRFVRNQSGDRGSFFGNSRRGIACAAFRNFMNLDAAKAGFAAGLIEAFAVTVRKLSFRPLFEFADGNDDDAHARKLTCAPAL